MGKKEEWEEIEKFERKEEQKKLEEYRGVDVTKEYEEILNKPKNNVRKRIILNIAKSILKILILFLIIYVAYNFYTLFTVILSNITNVHNVDVEESIETSTNIKIDLISENIDKNELKEEYYFKIEKFPQIQFKAVKNYGIEKNDLSANLHKYLFGNWDNQNKSKFQIYENRTKEGLLEYETYININTYDELQEGTNLIIEFLEYMENWNIKNGEVIKVIYKQADEFVYPLGQIYLMEDENKISPYREWYQTKQDIINEAKEQFDKLNSDTVNNNNNSESDNNVIEEEI